MLYKGEKYINNGLNRIGNINKYQLGSVNRLKNVYEYAKIRRIFYVF